MDESSKTIPDAAFAADVLVQHSEQRRQDQLNPAELAVTRELLAVARVLLVLAADRTFSDHAEERIGKMRDKIKAWLLALGAVIGVGISLVTAYKTLGG